jgi:predicted transcriptional regulator
VKLVVPTDFDILEEMSGGQRETAPNLAKMLEHRRQYMNNRLSHLAGIGLVKKIGPSERSGMYRITSLGNKALDHRDEYEDVSSECFSNLVKGVEEVESNSKYETILSTLTEQEARYLDELADLTALSRDELQAILQSLELRGLVNRIDEEKYEVTAVGERVLQSIRESSSEARRVT